MRPPTACFDGAPRIELDVFAGIRLFVMPSLGALFAHLGGIDPRRFERRWRILPRTLDTILVVLLDLLDWQ